MRENVVVETRTCQVPDVITTSRTHGWPKDPGWAVPDAATTYATRSAASTGSWSSLVEHGPDIRGNRVAHRPVPSVSYLALTASRPELKTAGNGSERIGTRRSKREVRTALCQVGRRVRFPPAPPVGNGPGRKSWPVLFSHTARALWREIRECDRASGSRERLPGSPTRRRRRRP